MQLSPDQLPILCVIILYFARIREFFVKRNVVSGQVNEKATFLALLLSGTLVIVLALVEYLARDLHFIAATFIPGILIAGSAFVVRAAAVRALGRMWSVHIEIRKEHQLVQDGPFRWIRHPIYLGAILELLGAIIFLNASYTLVAFVVLFIPSLVARIRLEERAMIAQFGDAYRDYIRTTPAVIPWKFPKKA